MGTDIATTSAALAVRADQTQWSDDQLAVLRHMATDKATPADLRVFLHRCQQLELDPFAGQIHLVEYGGKPTIQVGIHGLESTARTTADRGGFDIEWEDDLWCGPDGQWTDVWLAEDPPTAAKATLLRDGKRYSAVALYREFVGMKKVYQDKKWTGRWEVNSMWSGKPAHMLGKCARAGALRKAFPRQLANVYTAEELGERPPTVTGEVVTGDGPTGLGDALGLVAAATTRGELLAIWEHTAPQLTVTDLARLQQACQQAAAAVEEATQPPAGDPDPADPDPSEGQATRSATAAGVAALCDTLGYRDTPDQLVLVRALTGRDLDTLTDLTSTELWRITVDLTAATAAADPQAAIEDLLTTAP